MKPISLAVKGQVVLVDEIDYFIVSQYRWHINDKGYAVWRGIKDGKKQTVRMHRLITNAPDGMDVDHINRNRLDNRRQNLRVCSRKTNLSNSTKVLEAKGYWYDKTRKNWQVNTKPRHRFATEEEARIHVSKRR